MKNLLVSVLLLFVGCAGIEKTPTPMVTETKTIVPNYSLPRALWGVDLSEAQKISDEEAKKIPRR